MLGRDIWGTFFFGGGGDARDSLAVLGRQLGCSGGGGRRGEGLLGCFEGGTVGLF